MLGVIVLCVLDIWLVRSQTTANSLPHAVHSVGVGYNLLYGNPEGEHWKSGGEDPGLLTTRHILALDFDNGTPDELIYEYHDTCVRSRREALVYSTKSYQDELLQRVTLDGGQISSITDLAFSLSAGYRAVDLETRAQDYILQDSSTTCTHGSARYKLSLAATNYYQLTDEFIQDVCQLTQGYDQTLYFHFIDRWGTHVVTGLKLGASQTNRTIVKINNYIQKLLLKVPDDISVTGPPQAISSVYHVDVESLKLRPDFPFEVSGTRYNLTTGTPNVVQEPIGLDLFSIDVALTNNFWPPGIADEMCPDAEGTIDFLSTRRTNLLQALGEYGQVKGAISPKDSGLTMPVDWPEGTYGLPKPTDGCPHQNQTTRWLEGWLKQNPETQTPNSAWNASHMSGFLTETIFDLEFCVKPEETAYSLSWPAGDYCIFKHLNCPEGFAEGFVLWDDEDDNNANAHGGVLPDGDYGENTRMEYCCRSDGQVYNPIILPTESPFYLFQYKHDCQQVSGMSNSVEYLLWDDDDKTAPSTADIGSVHPGMIFGNPPQYDVPGAGTSSRIFYCYYTPITSSGDAIIG